MSIADNLARVRERMAAACAAADRSVDEVRLLPVSKTVGAQAVREAWAAGVTMVGENRVQEARGKVDALADIDIRWSIIGHLQTNKVKDVASFADEFQALDSLRLAAALDRRLQSEGRSLDVFVQVNSSGEAQKSGLAPADVGGFTAQLGAYDSLHVVGLMTVAVLSDDRLAVAACFEELARLRERLRDRDGGGWEELSMGMSGDFELAIAHGATVVRLGTAVFGTRP